MKSINYRIINYIGIGAAICCLFACSKMNATYKDFVKDGVVIYPGKADSLKAFPGRGRLELFWTLSDPKVKHCRVYWNQGKDSMDVPIQQITGMDTVRVTIDNLQEGVYTFKVYSYDKDGHVSVASEVVGSVYGDRYGNLLVNRFIQSLAVEDGKLVPDWSVPDDGTIGEEISYTDRNGDPRRMFMPVHDSTAGIDNIKPGSSFQYRTLFLPDPLAIDTFYSPSQTVTVEAKLFQVMLDKSLFKAVHLPTDTYQPHGASNIMDNIWDGKWGGSSDFLTNPGSGFPQWFTFDLGVKAQLSRMKYHQRGGSATRLYEGGNIKKFEIWGSDDPNPDGSWDGSWTLLLTCKSKKPSGSPPGEVTQEDIDYALAGEEFIFPDTIPAVRYIRVKTFENWDTKNRSYVNIGELTFWATEIE